LIALVWCA